MSSAIHSQFIFFYIVNIIFTFFWDRFKHIGDSQYLEIVTTSKEIMSFHDYGVVVLRFAHSRNELYGNTAFS